MSVTPKEFARSAEILAEVLPGREIGTAYQMIGDGISPVIVIQGHPKIASPDDDATIELAGAISAMFDGIESKCCMVCSEAPDKHAESGETILLIRFAPPPSEMKEGLII